MQQRSTKQLFPITVIGSFPRPDYLKVPSWFDNRLGDSASEKNQGKFSVHDFTAWQKTIDADQLKQDVERAKKEVIQKQIDLGIDVVTDGEIERENYIHYHCRHLQGFDFETAELVTYRGGATSGVIPKVVGKVGAGEPFLVDSYLQSQKGSSVPVKVTVPGPLTVRDTSNNQFYENPEELCWDLAVAINEEIKRLAAAGCTNIQVDEPLFARQVAQAHKFGFRCLDRCLEGVDLQKVYTTVHICCGYSDCLDQEDYCKAENNSYVQLAEGLDKSLFRAVSIEDAHTRIPDSFFQKCQRIDIVLGAVQVVRSSYLPAEEIVARVKYIVNLGVDPKRIILAPDCGLAMLDISQVEKKMTNLNAARNQLRSDYTRHVNL